MLEPAKTPMGAGVAARIAAGAFQGFPGALEKYPVLRIG